MAEPEFVTVAEAAEALSVSAPRLRRLLARPEWSERTETRTRQTRTGTRTGTVLNRSLLPELVIALESTGAPVDVEGKTEERERERIATGTRTGTGTVRNENENATQGEDWRTRALVAEARAELLERERNDWKEQAAGALEALQRAQDEARAARLIGGREIRQVEGFEASGEPPATQEDKPRPWWAYLNRRR